MAEINLNNNKKFGYYLAGDRDEDVRKEAMLKACGCEKVFIENLSEKQKERTVLVYLLEQVRKGDTIVVCHINELGKTKNQLIDFLFDLQVNAVRFKSLDNRHFDTTAENHQLSEIVVQLKIMDTDIKSGLIKTSMRVRGRKGGRPAGSYDKKKAGAVAKKYELGVPVEEICAEHQISKSTLYRYLKLEGVK